MKRPGLVGERAIALFILAFLAFNPPILSIFSAEAFLFGLPLLYVYLFCAWAGIIALVGLQAAAAARSLDESGEPPTRRTPRGNG